MSEVAKAKREKAEDEKRKIEEEAKPKFEESHTHLPQKENVHDYFKRKMAERTQRLKLGLESKSILFLNNSILKFYLDIIYSFRWSKTRSATGKFYKS